MSVPPSESFDLQDQIEEATGWRMTNLSVGKELNGDLIERAEAAWKEWGHLAIIPELVAALKAAHAENERLRRCRTCGNRTDPNLAGQNSDRCDCR